MHLAEAQLLVQQLCPLVVVQHRQVHVFAAAFAEIFRQAAHQQLADTRAAGLWVHRQAPEAGSARGVAEQRDMVDTHYGADDRIAVLVHGDQVDKILVSTGIPHVLGVGRHHIPLEVQIIDCLRLLTGFDPGDLDALERFFEKGLVQVQSVGVGGIEKQRLWRSREHEVGVGNIHGDVALSRALLEQLGGDLFGLLKGMAHDDAAPAAEYRGVLLELSFTVTFLENGVQVLVGRRLVGEAHTLAPGVHGHTPWVCSHSSSSPSCQSFEPRSGVMWSSGADSSFSM